MKRKILLSALALALLVLGMLSLTAMASGENSSHYWIDLTEDTSVVHVTGYIKVGGTGGIRAGYDSGKTVYSKDAAALYSEPNTEDVKAKVKECTEEVSKLVDRFWRVDKNAVKITTSDPETGKNWDKRVYLMCDYAETVWDSNLSAAYYVFQCDLGSETHTVAITDTAHKDLVTKGYDHYYIDDQFRDKITDSTNLSLAYGDYGKEFSIRVEATGEINDYVISVSGRGHGTASASAESALKGTEVTLTAVPDEGYELDSWQVKAGGVTVSGNKFTVGTADVVIEAVFRPKGIGFRLGASEGGGFIWSTGSNAHDSQICKDSLNVTADYDDTLKLNAVPDPGWKFTGWYEGTVSNYYVSGHTDKLISADVIYSFTVKEGKNLCAVFEKVQDPAGTGETGTVDTGTSDTDPAEPVIMEKPLKISVKGLKLAAKKNTITVSWTKFAKKDLKKVKALQKKLRIEIQISTDKKFAKGVTTKVLKYTKTKYTFKKLKPGKKYYVRVRVFAEDGNVKYVSKWAKKNLKLKKK